MTDPDDYPSGAGWLAFAAIVIVAIFLLGCTTTREVVVEAKPQRCEVPAAAVETVPGPGKLTAGAKNEDMLRRMGELEAALEKCNGRLEAVPGIVNTAPEKPETKGLRERLRAILNRRKESP